ncbi:MAG TPA: hypothetical protein VFS00_07595, partial [Polyangiaceae bacterium]|nr:hypothetical protein [Polyangiaceae bacterium]
LVPHEEEDDTRTTLVPDEEDGEADDEADGERATLIPEAKAGARAVDAEAGALDAEARAALAAAAVAAGGPLAQALARRNLRLDLAALRPFARWVTPQAEPRRYDAFFFLLRLPEGQRGESDLGETTRGFWATPTEVIKRFTEGTLMLAPPTLRCLELLAAEASIESAFALAERQSLLPVCPQFVPGADPPALVLPGDPAHAVAERRVAGPLRFVLREGRFLSEGAP